MSGGAPSRALLLEDGRLRVGEAGAGDGAQVVEMLRAGICGTDVQIARGVRGDRARILGHEGAGRLAASPGVPGRTVVPNPVNVHDQDSILGHSYDGIFRDRAALAPVAEGVPALVEAAPGLPLDLAPLVEPLATTLYARTLLGEAAHGSIGIWGGGATGMLHALLATREGTPAHVVHHGERDDDWVGAGLPVASATPASSFSARRVRAANGGRPLSAAVLCVPRWGAETALTQALSVLEPGGVIDLFGGFGAGDRHPDLPDVDLQAVRRSNVCGSVSEPLSAVTRDGKPVRLTGHRGTSDAQLLEAQALILSDPAAFAAVVTHVVSLDTAARWLSARVRGRWPEPRVGKVVIDFGFEDERARRPDLGVTVA